MNQVRIVLIALVVVAGSVGPAHAFPEIKKEFRNKYVKGEPATEAEKSLKAAVEKADCAVCHVPDMDKKIRNSYGKAISKFVPEVIGIAEPTADDKKKLKKAPDKIQQLLDKAAKESSDPEKPGAPTFGDLIKDGKLPGN